MRRFAVMMMLVLGAFALQAQEDIDADRPGFADGPGLLKPGEVQLEIGPFYTEESFTLPTLLRLGITRKLEFQLGSDVAELEERDFANLEAGLKLGISDSWSLFAGVGFPGGEGVNETDTYGAELRLLGEIELGETLSFVPNVGAEWSEEEDSLEYIAAGSLELEIGRAKPFIDFEARKAEDEEDISAIVDAGIAWVLNKDTQLDLSGGKEVAGEAYPEWFVSVGISRRF